MMKKTMFMIFAAILLLAVFSCKKKKNCKECGWYNETTGDLILSVGQKCDGEINAFLQESKKPVNTTTIKSVVYQVPKCN